MGVVFSGMFGLGIVMFVAVKPDVHLDHILFGNMLGVDATELWQSGVISAFVALVLMAAGVIHWQLDRQLRASAEASRSKAAAPSVPTNFIRL